MMSFVVFLPTKKIKKKKKKHLYIFSLFCFFLLFHTTSHNTVLFLFIPEVQIMAPGQNSIVGGSALIANFLNSSGIEFNDKDIKYDALDDMWKTECSSNKTSARFVSKQIERVFGDGSTVDVHFIQSTAMSLVPHSEVKKILDSDNKHSSNENSGGYGSERLNTSKFAAAYEMQRSSSSSYYSFAFKLFLMFVFLMVAFSALALYSIRAEFLDKHSSTQQ